MQPRECDADSAYRAVSDLPGWLTRKQAGVLHAAASALPDGAVVVEIGSHHGRSTVVLASALADGARLVAVDPFPPDWRYGAEGTEAALRGNLDAAGVAARVDVRATTSRAARRSWAASGAASGAGPVALVYVDGKHDVVSALHDIGWSGFVPEGGRVLVHDAFSSLGVTLAVLIGVLPSRRLAYAGRAGSLITLERRRPSLGDRSALLAQLPWFVRNLVVKVLLRLRLRGVARLLGHDDVADPY